MFHTSPNEIKTGTIHGNGIAEDCLFFSDNVYLMTQTRPYYVYEAEFKCIEACSLYDEEIVNEIMEAVSCDENTAIELLCGTKNLIDLLDFEGGEPFDVDLDFWIQGARGKCAVKMGFDGCKDVDEQGTVYIVPMKGREQELKLKEVVKC